MSQPLLAGVDGENATAALYDLLGDDDLSDRIYDASRGSPEMDVRPIIEMWLEDNMPDLAAKVIANSDMADEEPAPEPEQAPAPEAPPAEEPAPEQDLSQAPPEGEPNPDDIAAQMPKPGQTESVDHLASLRRLAGLK
jgi:pyruvate/2-oxoglutarate dehydrogenase complex dihydrolipoamide acyltransferase (E2) component